jgi:hypothetical protein
METEPNTGILMPPDFERLEGKVDFLLAQTSGLGADVAVLKSHQTDIAQANIDQHAVIVGRMDTLCEQGRVRNGRLEKLEDGMSGLKTWRGWATGVVIGGGTFVAIYAKLLWDHITK